MTYEDFMRRPISERRTKCHELMTKYPDRVPVIISSRDFKLKKFKYLVHSHMTVGQLFYYLRRNAVTLGEDEAMFVLVNDHTLPSITHTVSDLYHEYKDPLDGFLYLTLSAESTFG